ncbi:hypothetical protein ID0562_08960 [Helicobacter pylori]
MKTETTIFVDWENLLTDLRAIQKNPKTDKRFKEPEEELKRIYFYASESFTEVEPRIKGNKNKELEKYKDKNPKDYEKRMNKSGIIQAFNHEIAQQNQVKLRVGRVMFGFEFEVKEVYNGLYRI